MLQDVAPNDGVEELFERHLGGVAHVERHVAERPGIGARARRGERRRRPIDPDHLPGLTHHLCHEERDIADTGADIEHTHAWDDPRIAEEPVRDRVEHAPLRTQSLKLAI
jgi:hypothetical protein